MKTKYTAIFLFITFLILFLNSTNTFALQIKQINYNASNNNDRWVEIYNDGEDISDFTSSDYKVLTSKDVKDGKNTKHGISVLQGDTTFPAGSSVYISPSKTNIPIGATKVFYSNYNLDDKNGYLILSTFENYVCQNYGDGVCIESENIENQNTDSTSTNSTSTSGMDSDNSSSQNIKYIYVPMNNQDKYGDIQVLLPEEKIVPALADVDYSLKAIDSEKNSLGNLDFHWSFGDGGEKFGKEVSYSYGYPGDYILIASADGYTSGAKAEMNVKVVTPDIIIKRVGLGREDNVIDIENKTDYDLFLSNFRLKVDGKIYKLPKDFLIAKKRVVHISGDALGFNLPATQISLLYPNGNFLVNYTYSNASETKLINASNTQTLSTEEATVTNTVLNTHTQKDFREFISNKESDNLEEKVPTNTNRNIEKVGIKSDDPIIIKRLVLEDDIENTKKSINIENLYQYKSNNIDKNNDVDISLISWLKNLIY